ncbi:retrotransposon protein, putative, ty1-copia subclass [Tanacetum coccineum]
MASLEVCDAVSTLWNGANTCNNDKNLSEIQLEHEKEDELVVVVVKVVHELDCMMVVKEIENRLLEEVEKFGWWFEQDIGGENVDDNDKKLVMMAAVAQNTNNTTIRSVLLAEKLAGLNFTNWYRNLRIVLRYEKKMKFVEQPIGPAPNLETDDPDTIDKYYESVNLEQEVACLMLSRGWSISKLLSLKDEELLGHFGMPRLCNAKRTCYTKGNIQKEKKKLQGAKGKGKGNNKLAYAPKAKISPPPKRDNPTKDSICHRCKGGLRESRKLKHRALSLYMGNGMRAAVEAIGSSDLILPSGLIIVLDNCHFAPTITRGVVSISRLVNNGYIHTFTNYGISVSKDNVFYFNAIPCDGIYGTDMHNLYPNVSSMYNVRSKRAKHALDPYYLWHCRLGHINKKHMDMLHRDGLLQPTHDESHEKCKSCISGKMERKPFPHQVERAKDLLGLIHTDTAARILNMVPTKKVDRTPYEIWHGKAPKLSYLRVWGCEALMKRDTPDKLDSRSIKCIFVEASRSHELLKMSESDKGLELIQEVDTQSSENTSKAHNEVAPIEVEPQNVRVPIYPESDKWLEAMNTKMQSLRDNQVWYLVDLPSNGRTVRFKWLFKKKIDMDGNVHTFKARLVAKGFTQTYRVDYGKTFSPVEDIRAIRILLAIPQGFVDPKHPNKVCKLQRFIYGLKQAFRSWNKRFDEEFKKIDFTQNADEPCVYLKASGSNVAFLILYVDDMLLMRNSVTMLQEVKSWLCKCFSMKDLGEAAYMLGIKIIRDRSKRLIAFSQSAYLKKILNKFRIKNSKKWYTSMMENPNYRKSQGVKTPTEVQQPEDELKVSFVDWKSAKKSTTAMSSTEAEHIAAAEASMEAVWMRKFINGLGDVMPSNKRPMEMLCNNERSQNLKDDNAADPFIKLMPFNKHFEHAMAIGIVPASSLM